MRNKLLQLLLLIISANLAAQNLYENPGFEYGRKIGYTYTTTRSDALFEIINDITHSGDSALKISINSVGSGGPQVIAVSQNFSSLIQGEHYKLRVAVNAPSAGLRFRFKIFGSSTPQMFFTSKEGWNTYEWDIESMTAPKISGVHLIGLHFGLAGNEGVWIVDDLSLEKAIPVIPKKSNKYVSPKGDDRSDGSIETPYKTIAHAVSILTPGDTLFLREGHYHEEVSVNGLNGTKSNPIIIMNFNNEKVVLDGSVTVENLGSPGWELYDGNIYKTQLSEDIWQVFVDEEWMMLARWPNARFDDNSVWNMNSWAQGDESGSQLYDTYGQMKDDPKPGQDLAASGLDVTGAMAVLKTWGINARPVSSHQASSAVFQYAPVLNSYRNHNLAYFFDSKLNLLDQEKEWFFDKITKTLYLWFPGGSQPDTGRVRVKNMTNAFVLDQCEHVKIQGLNFFASTFKVSSSKNISVSDCNLNYPCFNRRTLGDYGSISGTQLVNCSYSEIVNCTFAYTDGRVLLVKNGNNNLVENCEFHHIDYSVAHQEGTTSTVRFTSPSSVFRRNTMYSTGASHGVIPSDNVVIEFNEFYDIATLQSDAAAVHLFQGDRNVLVQNNWFHDLQRTSIRFSDGPKEYLPPAPLMRTGIIRNNVSFNNQSGITCYMVKGDEREVYHNTVDNKIIFADLSETPSSGIHANSVSANNALSDFLSIKKDAFPRPSGKHSANWEGYFTKKDLKEQVFDWHNKDFRPRPDLFLIDAGIVIEGKTADFIGCAPDIGAYELGDSIYWIPGRKSSIASCPIPQNTGISQYEFVELMWLEGYKSQFSDIYFGESKSAVESAGRTSPEYRGRQSNNIFNPGALDANQTYYWRIDAVKDDVILKGEIWEFTAGIDANPATNTVRFEIYGQKDGQVSLLENVLVSFDEREAQTNDSGKADFLLVKSKLLNYKIEKKGYHSSTKTVTLSEDYVVKDTMEYVRYEVQVKLLDTDTEELISGALVQLGDRSAVTDHNGIVLFSNVDYDVYDLKVSADIYNETETHLVELWSDTTIIAFLTKNYLDVSFKVYDRNTGKGLPGAYLYVNGNTLRTNTEGQLSISKLQEGDTLIYQLEKKGYNNVSGELVLAGSLEKEITMYPITAKITFEVSDSYGPVYYAQVNFNSNSSYTNSSGLVIFNETPTKQSLQCEVSKIGYEKYLNDFSFESDTIIKIQLEMPMIDEELHASKFKISPNPTLGEVFINGLDEPVNMELITSRGTIIRARKLTKDNNIVDLGQHPAGLYILKIWNNKLFYMHPVLKTE